MSHLLGLCGSLRKDSLNRKLMLEAGAMFGAPVVEGNLRLPLYDGDLEAEGIPAEVTELAQQVADARAVLIVTPEYNKALSGVLKNALDWISRAGGAPWKDKPVAIMSATAGRAGGERAQSSLRLCMAPFRPHLVAGPEVLVGSAQNEFDETGTLTNDRYRAALQELMDILKAASL